MKYIGRAFITDPAFVTVKCVASLGVYTPGGIWVEVPEIGLSNPNLVYCMYGLSIPYYRIQVGEEVWCEPTKDDFERWVYTGLVDCGGNVPTALSQYLVKQLLPGVYEIDLAGVVTIIADSTVGVYEITTPLATLEIDVTGIIKMNGSNLEVLP